MPKKVIFISLALFMIILISGGLIFLNQKNTKNDAHPSENLSKETVIIPSPNVPTLSVRQTPKKEVGNQASLSGEIIVHPKESIDPRMLGFVSPDYQEKNKKEFGVEENGLVTILKQKYGQTLPVILNNSDGSFAQGTIQEKNGQDKWWLATKTDAGQWKIVTDGYTYAECNDIAAYKFPVSMVPVCWNSAKNTLINR